MAHEDYCLSKMGLKKFLALTATVLCTASCGSEPAEKPAPNTANISSTPAKTRAPKAVPAPGQATKAARDAPLTAEGWGPLRVGMTLPQITAALGPDGNPDAVGGADPAQCDEFRPARAPQGLLVMVEDGRLSRISLINNSRVKTDRGLGLGAAPAAIRTIYGPALRAELHKYESPPAQYLTFWSKGGGPGSGLIATASRGIRFEVDSTGRVATIHAGGPSIGYVEGCA